MADAWRLFIAIELPPAVIDSISAVLNTLKPRFPDKAMRWVRPEGMHLTLKFLGDTDVSQIDAVKMAMGDALTGQGWFSLSVNGVGCFPNTRQPRVVWLGVEGDTRQLGAAHTRIEKHVSPLGFPTDNRSFNPHLTLARVDRRASKGDVGRIGQTVLSLDIAHIAAWDVREVSLMRSELKSGGAVYTALHHEALNG